MAHLALAMLILAAAAGHSSAAWCVCKDGVGEGSLQKALDYACGAGADCNPIRQNAACFLPNTVRAHCSYAVNSYFQKKGQTQGSCDFAGVAAISTSDPSSAGCSYPSSAGGGGGGSSAPGTTTPVTTVPGTMTPSTRPPVTTMTPPSTTTTPTPYTATPTGVLGGAGGGPSGAGITTDTSHGGFKLSQNCILFVSVFNAALIGFMLRWDY